MTNSATSEILERITNPKIKDLTVSLFSNASGSVPFGWEMDTPRAKFDMSAMEQQIRDGKWQVMQTMIDTFVVHGPGMVWTIKFHVGGE